MLRTVPGFQMSPRDLNTDPHACETTLHMELAPQPCTLSLVWGRVSPCLRTCEQQSKALVLSPLVPDSGEHKWPDLFSHRRERACFYFKSRKRLCAFTFSNRSSACVIKVINNSPAVCWVQGRDRLFRLSNVVIMNCLSSSESRKTSKACNNLGKMSFQDTWYGLGI